MTFIEKCDSPVVKLDSEVRSVLPQAHASDTAFFEMHWAPPPQTACWAAAIPYSPASLVSLRPIFKAALSSFCLRLFLQGLLLFVWLICTHYWRGLEGFPSGARGKESTCQCRRCKTCGFDPWVGKIPWSRKWQPTSAFLPGKFHGGLQSMGLQKVRHNWACSCAGWDPEPHTSRAR